jgi:hypothetical protein
MARILRVSSAHTGAYPTIRDALEVAPDGAVIGIDAGEYPETIQLGAGRRLTLRAARDPGSVTVAATGAAAPARCTGTGGAGPLHRHRRRRHRARARAAPFAKTLEFENYGAEELVLIANTIARNDDYDFGSGLDDALLE